MEVRDLRRFGSAALDLAFVAAGRLDGFWETHLHSWDCLAGLLMVQEAGGRRAITAAAQPICTAARRSSPRNGLIHDRVLAVLNQALSYGRINSD